MDEAEKDFRIRPTLRGQAWVELHGTFTANELHSIAQEIEKKCQGLEKKDVVQGRHNN